ncbi:MAG: carbon-nitrogen hydrolase family protein [Deltaproteobacteria bacterium]|nr:carbon-nitrogen hydrolase family protein [Deltaproteobacteria bacterium]
MRSYLVAAVQMTASSSKEENLAKAETFVRLAAERGASVIVLPEVFAWRGPRAEEPPQVEPIPGPTSERLRDVARRYRIHLLAGSFLEKSEEARAFNTSLLFGPEGDILAHYRKIHLFDVDIPGQVRVKESDTKKPGQDVVASETALGVFGLSVCYDLRFPELYRQLAAKGAEVLFVPSAFTFPTGAAHWEPLLRARAIENQAYVIAPNQIGKNTHGFADYGNSMIVDPWGKVLARAADKECFITAEIDRDYLEKVRRELPCLVHRRL